jgi:hypothetical protein
MQCDNCRATSNNLVVRINQQEANLSCIPRGGVQASLHNCSGGD